MSGSTTFRSGLHWNLVTSTRISSTHQERLQEKRLKRTNHLKLTTTTVVGTYAQYSKTVNESANLIALMKAKVNPSQKDPNKHQENWIIVSKKTGTIKAAHCTCMTG